VKRLRELCTELGLPPEAEGKLELLLDQLARDPVAPSTVTTPEQAVDVHLADSLSVLPLIRGETTPKAIVDIGSGAGFPGLPLAIVLEQAEVDLVESTARKCAFIERAVERLGLGNARVVCARVEDWACTGEGAGRHDLAVVRAVAPLATLVEYASPLLRIGGRLVCWKGARDRDEERRGEAAAQVLGMAHSATERVTPFPGAREHHLHVFRKVGPVPAEVPRRAGMAKKRPFGSE
jgi:16S rRNA (guanine527-N7)-methyltransferase